MANLSVVHVVTRQTRGAGSVDEFVEGGRDAPKASHEAALPVPRTHFAITVSHTAKSSRANRKSIGNVQTVGREP